MASSNLPVSASNPEHESPKPLPNPEPERIHIEHLPVIDLRGFTQSQLYTLSLCTNKPRPFESDVVEAFNPSIDRRVFNESAASRRQTFSRFRFPSANSRPCKIPRRRESDPEEKEDPQVVSVMKELFGIDASASGDDDDRIPPVTPN